MTAKDNDMHDGAEQAGQAIDYVTLTKEIAALCAGETDPVALMASVACVVHHADPRFDWTGFYRVVAPGLLKIGPYQGGIGCLTIPFESGVCGACARTGQVQRVANVHAFPGHIACSGATRSELVLPVFDARQTLIAVFDLDSNQPDAFTERDARGFATMLDVVFARP